MLHRYSTLLGPGGSNSSLLFKIFPQSGACWSLHSSSSKTADAISIFLLSAIYCLFLRLLFSDASECSGRCWCSIVSLPDCSLFLVFVQFWNTYVLIAFCLIRPCPAKECFWSRKNRFLWSLSLTCLPFDCPSQSTRNQCGTRTAFHGFQDEPKKVEKDVSWANNWNKNGKNWVHVNDLWMR